VSSSIPPPRFVRPDPLVDSVINGKYRVGTLVASGGMGRIYRAEQLPLGRTVALKVLHVQATAHLDDPAFKKRFLREASILSKLQHPNIVTVFDYGAIEGPEERYFMTMEFLQGETLLRRINDQGSLSPRDTIRVARQIARGLCEAHAAGIVHRDLKPANVMLVAGRSEGARPGEAEELVKVLDFGIVKVVGDEDPLEDLTQEGAFIGSPKYMAPEQIRRGAKVDPRTDIYSLGIILYQCLCGEVPFDASGSIETMMLHLNKTAVHIRERAPGANAPEWLEDLVMACLEKDPDKRPQTMEAVARILSSGETESDSRSLSKMHIAPTSSPSAAPGGGSGARRAGSLDSPTITETGASASLPPHDGPQSTPAPRSRVSPGMIAAVFLGALLLFAVVRATDRPAQRAEDTASSGPGARGAGASEISAAPAPKRAFQMIVESTPSGAEVRQSNQRDQLLGTTPLTISIDNEAVRIEPRKLTIARPGYQPYSIVQGPSEENVRVLATLLEAPAASAAPTAASAAAPGRTRSLHEPNEPSERTRADAAKTDAGAKLDIRLTR
jgi:serine/threonine-protein kinase